MCSSNQIHCGGDRGGDLGVMRKWKCLPRAEEQLSNPGRDPGARGQETLTEGSAFVHGFSISGGEGL